IIHYANGDRFKGTYKNGLRNGRAIEESKDGTRFEGTYVNDIRDGKFVEKDRNGQITFNGHYESGRRFNDN
ncbi:MAG: phosphatidylinositol-4-phosphate 5-kinase, partial [Prevotella sp.]|nr:phosphatidylinositol-4-phosphate 5-kinase [Prevotella sp.]